MAQGGLETKSGDTKARHAIDGDERARGVGRPKDEV